MGELKKIRVREARFGDIGLFKKLWGKLLKRQVAEGSHIAANEQSMRLYESLFDAYVASELEGVVLFVADKGVLMWGDPSSPLDFSGKVVMAWGSYVEPEAVEGVEEALRSYAEDWAKEKGFTLLLAQIYKDSQPIAGYEEVATVVRRPLQ